MLFQLVDRVCADVDRLSFTEARPAVESQLRQYAPEVIGQLIQESKSHGNQPMEDAAVTVLAMGTFGYIKGIPALARKMVEKVNDRKVATSHRCAVASVLAYFVQPHDLISDTAPGGYGFLDDAVLLRAGLVEYLNTLPHPEIGLEVEQKIIGFLVSLTPPQVRLGLQQCVSAMSLSVQVMSLLDGPIAELMLAQIVSNPLQGAAPSVPQGFVPHPTPNYDRGHWSGGAYFEGNNVVIPGGPSLIDGQLFIPS